MHDKLIQVSEAEVERALERRVHQLFEIARENGARQAPITADTIYPDMLPEHHTQLEERAVRAVLAKKWFAGEAPPWALALGGLPVTLDEITNLLNGVYQGKPRPRMLSDYGARARSAGWMLEYVGPFE